MRTKDRPTVLPGLEDLFYKRRTDDAERVADILHIPENEVYDAKARAKSRQINEVAMAIGERNLDKAIAKMYEHELRSCEVRRSVIREMHRIMDVDGAYIAAGAAYLFELLDEDIASFEDEAVDVIGACVKMHRLDDAAIVAVAFRVPKERLEQFGLELERFMQERANRWTDWRK